MPPVNDHYEAYYSDKLWMLLPAIYRSLDTDAFNSNGPLREIVNRIGAQAAIIRRSIDRLWEDQSIESCDSWVIPYIGDLLATNLVADDLDARGQRLDVAKDDLLPEAQRHCRGSRRDRARYHRLGCARSGVLPPPRTHAP